VTKEETAKREKTSLTAPLRFFLEYIERQT